MAFLKFRGNSTSPTKPSSTTAANTPLSNADIDGNFASLNDSKIEIGTNSSTPGFSAGDILYASAANTLSKLAKGSDGQVLKLSGGLPVWGTDNNTTYTVSDGAFAVSIGSTAATSGTALAWGTSSGFSANSASNTTYDLRVGPALTALSTLMSTAGAGFIRRGATADTYSIDTNTYSTTSHGHYIGTTAVQSSSANQALTGITGLSTPNSTTASAAITITSGLGTATSSTSGGVTISTGDTNGTVSNGGLSGGLRLETGNSGSNGGAGSIVLEAGVTAGSGSNNGVIYILGGSTSNGTSSDNGHIYIRAGVATAATGTKSGGKVWIDSGRPAAGGTIVDDGSVNIGTVVGSPGNYGTTLVNIGNTSSTTNIRGTVTVNGNLTVNGTTTTINSSTIAVDDKNIELGSVAAVTGLAATLVTGTAVVTLTGGTTTSGLIPGQALTKTSGAGVFGTTPVIVSINSLTQLTVSVNHATAGAITFSAGGVTDVTANGGGITLKGATDKTFQWLSSTGHWTSNVNLSAPVLVSTVATGTAPLTVASTTRVSNLNVATAGTADTLTNARTINGVSFNGSQNISINAFTSNVTLTAENPALTLKDTISPSNLSMHSILFTDVNNAEKVTFTTTDNSLYLALGGTNRYLFSYGATTGTNIYLYGNGTTTQNKTIRAFNGNFEVINSAYSQAILTLTDGGNLTAVGNVTGYSDERLKTNWQNLPDNFVEQLAEVKNGIYDRTDGDKLTQVGVSAQSLQKILPNAVIESDEYLSVAYGNAALASAVELAKEIVAMRNIITQLSDKVEDLQNQLMNK